MRYGSVCSGIEAASVAWSPLGWAAAWFAEIEAFPSAVLAHHYPETPNCGDFTTIAGEPGSIDLLVGGTPCQSFSVAGKRLGLDDPRGNLAIEFLRLARRACPRWLVWENVPGVLSSGGGRDFGAFLGLLGELGYGFAYRVLDAQFFGVPQRRRRVFVVGHLGDWRRAASVLFERDSLSGNPPPSREAGARVAQPANASPGMRGWAGDADDLIADTLMAHSGLHDNCGQTFVAGTITRQYGNQCGRDLERGDMIVAGPPICFDAEKSENENSTIGYHADLSPCIRAKDRLAVAFQCHGSNVGEMGTLRSGNGNTAGGVPFTFDERNVTSRINRTRIGPGLPCGTLHEQPHTVAYGISSDAVDRTGEGDGSAAERAGLGIVADCSPSLRARPNNSVAARSAVRRLTPRECERLQGFPDSWTAVPYRGKPASDGQRYKALGNSMAVPVMAWIGRRIQLADTL